MSGLFGSPSAPTPAPVPVAPSAADNAAAQAVRDNAARAAQAEMLQNGRRSTIVAGAKIADQTQQDRALLAKKKQSVSDLMG